jgi:predicted transcriptional regulator
VQNLAGYCGYYQHSQDNRALVAGQARVRRECTTGRRTETVDNIGAAVGEFQPQAAASDLSISSGAVSTAIKQLIPVGLIERVPAPGSRRDHYRFRNGAWATLMSQQNTMLATMREAAQEGIDATGDDTVTARRLHEMQDFYTYMTDELVPLIDRWRERYAAEHD